MQERAGDQECAGEVAIERALPVLAVEPLELIRSIHLAKDRHAGVVDEDADVAVRLRVLAQTLDVCLDREVCDDAMRGMTFGAQLGRTVTDAVGGGYDQDAVSRASQRPRGGEADAGGAARTRDDGDWRAATGAALRPCASSRTCLARCRSGSPPVRHAASASPGQRRRCRPARRCRRCAPACRRPRARQRCRTARLRRSSPTPSSRRRRTRAPRP